MNRSIQWIHLLTITAMSVSCATVDPNNTDEFLGIGERFNAPVQGEWTEDLEGEMKKKPVVDDDLYDFVDQTWKQEESALSDIIDDISGVDPDLHKPEIGLSDERELEDSSAYLEQRSAADVALASIWQDIAGGEGPDDASESVIEIASLQPDSILRLPPLNMLAHILPSAIHPRPSVMPETKGRLLRVASVKPRSLVGRGEDRLASLTPETPTLRTVSRPGPEPTALYSKTPTIQAALNLRPRKQRKSVQS